MKAVAAIVALATALPAAAAVERGATAPAFVTQVAKGGKTSTFALERALKTGPVVLYFFPAAFTSGCTVEARMFADAMPKFEAAGATVVGVAADPIDKLARFSVEECRSKFPVGVATSAMIAAYDVALPLIGKSNRTTFVIARNGKIAWTYSAMRPDGHVFGALAAVSALAKK